MRCAFFGAFLSAVLIATAAQAGEACDAWRVLPESERGGFLKELAERELQVFMAADALKGFDTKCFRAGYPGALEPTWVAACEKLEWSDYLLGRSVEGAVGLLVEKCASE